jgi:hypothetical protein
MTRKVAGDQHPDVVSPLYDLSWVLKQKGDFATGKTLHAEAASLSRNGGSYGARAFTDCDYDLADILQAQRRFAEAEPLFNEAWEYLQNNPGAHRVLKRDALERLVRFYEAWDLAAPNTGKASGAAAWRKELEKARGLDYL